MAMLVEDQIHQALIRLEEQRCQALEAENEKREETKGKKVIRRTVPKPWRRYKHSALCSEAGLLTHVEEADYDLVSQEFQDYCRDRGVLHVAGEPGSKRWAYFVDYNKTKDEYFADPHFQLAEPTNGQQHKYTEGEMESGWTTIRLGRAQLQDCWELFVRERR